jgi:hypothetical protein
MDQHLTAPETGRDVFLRTGTVWGVETRLDGADGRPSDVRAEGDDLTGFQLRSIEASPTAKSTPYSTGCL